MQVYTGELVWGTSPQCLQPYVHIVRSSHALIAHDWDSEKLDGALDLLIAFGVTALLHVEKDILKTTFMSDLTCSSAVVILT